jgi:hypothetical protein
MRLAKKLHKQVRGNWWFINRAPISILTATFFGIILVVDLALMLLENLTK